MTTTDTGRLGEGIAIDFLKKNKYKILGTNVHVSHNEIDIIAKDKTYIVFVEVKTRSSDTGLASYFGTPASAVVRSKQLRLIEAARGYLSACDCQGLQPRFDVIEVYISKADKRLLKINHIINAFGI